VKNKDFPQMHANKRKIFTGLHASHVNQA